MESQNNIHNLLTLELTPREEQLVSEFKALIKDHLVDNAHLNEQVRLAIANYGKDQHLLLKFIRGRKGDIPKALDSIKRYAELRFKTYPDLFPERIPEYAKYALESGTITVIKKRDSQGRTIILFRATHWKTSEITLEEIIVAGRYVVDALMNYPDFLTKGVILLTDCEGATLSHARFFTIPNIAKFVNIFWLAYPIQIKGLYYVNAPLFVRPVFTLIKPFLPAKLRERVLITSGVTELHKRIEPEILPESLGGVLMDEDAIANEFVKNVSEEVPNPTL